MSARFPLRAEVTGIKQQLKGIQLLLKRLGAFPGTGDATGNAAVAEITIGSDLAPIPGEAPLLSEQVLRVPKETRV